MQTYGGTAKTLHWLTFLLISGTFGLGLFVADLPTSPEKLKLLSWHKWAGVTVFVLVALRLGWRLLNTPPPLSAGMPAWERRAAEASHRLLYLLTLCLPLSGWIMSSALGFTTVWFGLLPLPNLLDKDLPLGKALEEVHGTLAWIVFGFVALHVAAAFKHHLIDRDDVLARMTPGVKPLPPKGN